MKTLLADDHPLMREGARQVLSQLEPPVEIVDAHDYPSRFPDIPLVVLSASESPHDIRSALEAGALGYIPKAASTAIFRAFGVTNRTEAVLAIQRRAHVP